MKYREDGDYSTDNNIAERKVRPLTVDRKNTKTSDVRMVLIAQVPLIIPLFRLVG